MAKYIVLNGIRIASDFVPETFGRLTTLGPKFRVNPNRGQSKTMQVCQCSCGKCDVYLRYNLANGHTQSCGCWAVDTVIERSTTHGDSKSREHIAWSSATKRCHNKNYWKYDRYGGRGIRVCDRWQGPMGYANFLADMGRKPSPKHTLDRIDVNGNYCPENCRWATQKEQCRNKENSKYLTAFGKIQCLSAWAEEYNITASLIHKRLRRGWDVERAIALPSQYTPLTAKKQ